MRRLRVDQISFRTYRIISVLGASAFVSMPFVMFGTLHISERWLGSDKPALGFILTYLGAALCLQIVNRNAFCPACESRLSFIAPFSAICGHCKSHLKTVRV
jgi:hypothetical protein